MWIVQMVNENGCCYFALSTKELAKDLTEFLESCNEKRYTCEEVKNADDEIVSMFKRCGFKSEKYHD